jgi:hypothetical protein
MTTKLRWIRLVGGRTLLATGALLLSPLSMIGSAQYDRGIWTHVASACAVDEASLTKYDQHVSVLGFKGANIGTLVARCNVENLPLEQMFEYPLLEVTYKDPDGFGTTFQVRAMLIMANETGTFKIAEFDSNNFPASPNFQRQAVSYSHTFDFAANAYYIDIRVTRNSTAESPTAAIVRLLSVIG